MTMAGALMPSALAPLRHAWAVDPGRGILLQGHDALILAALQGLLGGTQLRRDAPLHVAIPASGEEQPRGVLDHRLRRDMPEKQFEALSEEAVCSFMKLITLEKVRDSLRDMVYPITVPADIAARARAAVERMVAIS